MTPLTILTLALSFSSGFQCLQLPRPKGPFDIGTTYLRAHRPLPSRPLRSNPAEPFCPALRSLPNLRGQHTAFLYIPPLPHRGGIRGKDRAPCWDLTNISTYAHLNASILDGGRETPIILFSPGADESRLMYTTYIQDLASEGYTVVSIDHPYDGLIVELSDGGVITSNFTETPEGIDLALAVRAADARFVLDELANGRNVKVPGLGEGLDTNHVGFFGDSLGGATAATTMALDHRAVGGVNMDGTFFGLDVQRGFSKPFMIMAHEGHNRTTDASWAEVWAVLRGFKREIEIEGTLHATFTDRPVVSDLLGVDAKGTFGTILAPRFDDIQHAYLTAFFDFALRGKKEKLLDGISEEFPEISFH